MYCLQLCKSRFGLLASDWLSEIKTKCAFPHWLEQKLKTNKQSAERNIATE